MIPQEERGVAMSIWSFGPLWGPVLGPIAGGFLTQSIGWRWIFWVITIAVCNPMQRHQKESLTDIRQSGAVALTAAMFMRETYAPVLLGRKAKKLRKNTGDFSLKVEPVSSTPVSTSELFWRTITRPSKLILFSPIILSLGIYVGIVYGYLYLMLTTFTEVYEQKYGFGPGIVGLTYLGVRQKYALLLAGSSNVL